jgi:hypothetical protein
LEIPLILPNNSHDFLFAMEKNQRESRKVNVNIRAKPYPPKEWRRTTHKKQPARVVIDAYRNDFNNLR